MLRSIPELMDEVRAELRCITASEAMRELADEGGVVIDVREAAEVAAKPAPASQPISRGVLEMVVSAQYPNPDHAIYLHCASGVRAALAAEQLKRLGYKSVSVITCPIDEVCGCQAD